MKKQSKRRVVKRPRPKTDNVSPARPLNYSLVALIAIADYVLVDDCLATEQGRADLKGMFRQALIAVPEVQSSPEWAAAMGFVLGVNATIGVQ